MRSPRNGRNTCTRVINIQKFHWIKCDQEKSVLTQLNQHQIQMKWRWRHTTCNANGSPAIYSWCKPHLTDSYFSNDLHVHRKQACTGSHIKWGMPIKRRCIDVGLNWYLWGGRTESKTANFRPNFNVSPWYCPTFKWKTFFLRIRNRITVQPALN